MRLQTVVSDGEKGETKRGEKIIFFGGGGERKTRKLTLEGESSMLS